MINSNRCLKFVWPYFNIKRSEYRSELTDGRVEFNEVDAFLNDVEGLYYKIMRPVYYYIIITSIYMIVSVTSFTFNNGDGKQSADEKNWFYESCWYLSYLIVFTGGYLLYENKRGKIADGLHLLIHTYHSIFGARELRWVIPSSFPESIELWKDYIMSNDGTYLEMKNSEVDDCTALAGKGMS